MASLTWHPPVIGERTATYHWTAPYAIYVHEGTETTPARRWTDFAIAQNPPAQLMARHFAESGSIVDAFDATAESLYAAFTNAIESPIWSWDGITQRQNGSIVGSPRDIVDLGDLRDSLLPLKLS